MVREVIPWHHQFMVLFRRSCKEQWRRRSMLVTSMVQTLVMAVLIGTTWLMIGEQLFVVLGSDNTRGRGKAVEWGGDRRAGHVHGAVTGHGCAHWNDLAHDW